MNIIPKAPRRATLPLAAITPNPKNYNEHPVSQIKKLAAGIKLYGQPRPLLLRAANKMIIGGHGVYLALKEAGEDRADCLLWDVDQETADAFMIADNEMARLSNPDEAALRRLLDQVPIEHLPAVGFTAEEAEAILAEKESPDLIIKQIETGQVSDIFWITITGPLNRQAVVLQRLQQAVADVEDVEVELGTTPL